MRFRYSTSLRSGISVCGYLFLCLLCVLPAHAQKKKKNLPTEAKVEVPNCVWIDTLGLFADQTEVFNIHWLEFMAFYENSENAKYLPEEYPDLDSFRSKVLLLDTLVWYDIEIGRDTITRQSTNDSYVANYLRYPGFRYFPLVGISKYQAEFFCAWRSKVVTDGYNKAGKGLAKKYHVEITFRLPTKKEWEILAQGKNKHPHGFKKLSKKERKRYEPFQEGREYATCRKMTLDSTLYITDSPCSHPSNEYNLCDMIGNVAEMVQEEGIAKGGSWFHTLEESAIKERQIYTKPTAWLGFRCVATVKLTPKKKK